MQLYSIERNVSQQLKVHAASFLRVNLCGRTDPVQNLVFHEKNQSIILLFA
jgi:hypothetical protein